MAAARSDGVVLSKDSGQSWWPLGIPTVLTRIHRVAFSPDGTLWLGAREGVYFTRDKGKTWMWVHRLPLADVDDLYYDPHLDKVLVSSRNSDFVYAIDAKTLDWKWWQTGYRFSAVRAAGGRLAGGLAGRGRAGRTPRGGPGTRPKVMRFTEFRYHGQMKAESADSSSNPLFPQLRPAA